MDSWNDIINLIYPVGSKIVRATVETPSPFLIVTHSRTWHVTLAPQPNRQHTSELAPTPQVRTNPNNRCHPSTIQQQPKDIPAMPQNPFWHIFSLATSRKIRNGATAVCHCKFKLLFLKKKTLALHYLSLRSS